jgi:hypothetical protein
MRKLSLLIIASLSVLAFSAGSANAASGMKVAIEDEDVFLNNNSRISPDIGYVLLDDLGITTMRVLITQNSVQTGNRFDFTKYTDFLQIAQAHGIDVQVVLVGKFPRPNIPSFAKFAKAAAQAFRGQVTYYSIWNEPNQKGWLVPVQRAGILYRKIYTAGYKAVKQGDPSSKVLIGETAPIGSTQGWAPIRFLQQLACVDVKYKPLKGQRCPKLKADGYAHHPYDFGVPPNRSNRGPQNATIGTLINLRRALAKLRSRISGTSSIYLTEFGYLAQRAGRLRGLPEAQRAAYLKQGYAIARRTPGVKEMVQYLLVQPGHATAHTFTTGVISATGDPLPSYEALKASVH